VLSFTGSILQLLGNGDGTFQAPGPYSTTAEPTMVGLGDFTGSGNIDIVALEGTSTEGIICDCIEVLPGNGDGTFGAPISTTPVPDDVTGFAIAAGDFNDDGKLDVAVSGESFSGDQVDILLGNGNGTFTAEGSYTVSGTPQSIATGYFTSDKTKLDLAVANSLGSSVSVLLGNGDGTLQQSVYYPTSFPTWVIAQDLDGDGNIDLAASNAGVPEFTKEYPPGVSVLKGNGDGTFEPGVFYRSGNKIGVNYVAAGDFNEDHRPDLVLVVESGQVITLLNTGAVTFSPSTPLGFGTQAAGTTSTARTVTLTNTGTKPLEILSIKASPDFVVKSSCAARVASGANCTISAWFSPAKQGTKRGAIEIIDSASSKPQVIELFGTGT
jgi:FG-GAP-like repeat/Abnormal spindle-like microcephaly-assoc'd, ASPM-SPD-2-Hydin